MIKSFRMSYTARVIEIVFPIDLVIGQTNVFLDLS